MIVEVEGNTSTAFYDSNILVMTYGQKLREAPVDTLFNPSTRRLKVIGDIEMGVCPPNTVTQRTKRMKCISGSKSIHKYDVYNKEEGKIEMGH